ncbi:MAG: BTAD domain-containing putative transcriptional regulator [Candidatus Promineifilaceae bacterium]
MQSHHLRGEGSLQGADGIALLEVKAFGRLLISCNGTVVSTFPTRKAEELLAYLFLHQGNPHRRDKLIEILWPGAPADNGRGRLSTTLWRVRVLLNKLGVSPDSCLETDSESVALVAHPHSLIDVSVFQDHIHAAEATSVPEEKESLFRAAQSLYVGDLLEGIYSEWCLIERERLARLNLRLLGQLAACYINRGAYEEAIDTSHKILDIDPLREEVHRSLMLCYGKSGRRCDGIRQFQRCANLLLKELGIFPLPETIEIYRSLIATATDECLDTAADPHYQQQLQETFSDFMSLGDELVELLEGARQPELV